AHHVGSGQDVRDVGHAVAGLHLHRDLAVPGPGVVGLGGGPAHDRDEHRGEQREDDEHRHGNRDAAPAVGAAARGGGGLRGHAESELAHASPWSVGTLTPGALPVERSASRAVWSIMAAAEASTTDLRRRESSPPDCRARWAAVVVSRSSTRRTGTSTE